MFERYTHDARRAVVLAQEEARMLNHNYVGTEHLLLALINDRGLAGEALRDTEVSHYEARERVIEILGEGLSPQKGHIAFTPRAKEVLIAAFRAALEIGDRHIGPEHLLLALTSCPRGVSRQTLHRCGVAALTVQNRVLELMTQPGQEPKPESTFVLSA
jgi:ATP-dependent Clp protease ATP-binding subunit ClpC